MRPPARAIENGKSNELVACGAGVSPAIVVQGVPPAIVVQASRLQTLGIARLCRQHACTTEQQQAFGGFIAI